MLTPASALLATVLVLPAIQKQWRIGIYTVGVALLGVGSYALLQILRRFRVVRFCSNDSLDVERWSAPTLALALSALPGYAVCVALRSAAGASLGVALGGGLASGCLLCAALVIALTHAIERDDTKAQAHMDRDRSALLSIPEVGPSAPQAPLMRAFLRDSVVHADQELWFDPDVRGSAEFGGSLEAR